MFTQGKKTNASTKRGNGQAREGEDEKFFVRGTRMWLFMICGDSPRYDRVKMAVIHAPKVTSSPPSPPPTHPPLPPPTPTSIPATNNLAYILARDALHTLATAARQAPQSVGGTGLLAFEDPSRGLMKPGRLTIDASSQVDICS